MTTNYGQQVYSQGGGTASTQLLDAVREPRDPTPADNSFQLGKFWVDTSDNAVWYLASFSTAMGVLSANWVNISGGSILMAIQTINTIAPDGSGNFTLESMNGSVTITPEANAIDLSVARSPTKYDGNTGGDVVPNIANQLFIVGNNTTGINVVGNSPINTLTISALQATTTQEGTVTLATNAQAIAGTDTFNAVTSAALAAKLGTQTAHSLALFEGSTAALVPLGVATNGQIPIGSAGADPVLANITSSGGTIVVTNGAGSINIDLAGGHGAIEQFIPDSGTNPVVPNASGQVTMSGSGSTTTVGSLNTLTFELTGLTNHNVLIGAGTTTITKVAPSATSGVPLISQGAAADPTFGTAVVAGGGTGAVTFTAYAPICGGTTATGVLQSAGTGISNSGYILTSTGAASLPTWQAGASSAITLTGDTGGALTATSFTFNANSNSGSSVIFAGAGTTLSLEVSDTLGNTIIGQHCGNGSISGNTNTGVGFQSAMVLTSGANNCFLGYECFPRLTTGSNNVAIGTNCLEITTGSYNIAIGSLAGTAILTTESDNILISNTGTVSQSNAIHIGTQGSGNGQQNICFVAGITGATPTSANTPQVVLCDNAGNLAPISSSTSGFVLTSNGSATPSFQAISGLSLNITSVNNGASPYTVLVTDQFIACQTSTGVITIKLPNAPTTGRVIYIKDSNGAAATSNISVTTVGGAVTIDGQTTYTMATNYQSINVVFDGSNYEVF